MTQRSSVVKASAELNSSGQIEDAGLVGGTSVAAPSMAGIQALINQANGGRQGMPGYIYYTLANQQNDTNCNSSGPPGAGSNCAFQDITLGNNLICGLATGSCTATLTQAKIGFNAGTGYDMASGLGSPNAANLSSRWSRRSLQQLQHRPEPLANQWDQSRHCHHFERNRLRQCRNADRQCGFHCEPGGNRLGC